MSDAGSDSGRPRAVRKAVFPIAGLGTRMLPMTRAVPKEMIPVFDRPLIQYAVEEAIAAGISDLVFVTDRSGPMLETHFGPSPELEGKTETGPGGERLDAARALVPEDVRFEFVPQGRPLGLGHAVWCAREAVGDAPFAVVLPDDLMVPGALGELVEAFHARCAAGVVAVEEVPLRDTARYGVVAIEEVPLRDTARYGVVAIEEVPLRDTARYGVVAIEEVPLRDTARYGVVDTGGDSGRVSRITSIVEKPRPADAPSNLAVVGRYVFDASIMDILGAIRPGAGGEIQLTDAIAVLGPVGTRLREPFRR